MQTASNIKALKRLANYSTEVKRFIMAGGVEEHDANDILQNTYLKVLESVHTLKDESKEKAWLFTIARNAKNDFFRDQARSVKRFGVLIGLDDVLDLCYHDDRIESLVSDTMLADKIRHASADAINYAISKLPPRERAVFTLFYEDGLSWKEVAEAMNMKETTVRTAVFRHKADLIDYLKEYYEKENVL